MIAGEGTVFIIIIFLGAFLIMTNNADAACPSSLDFEIKLLGEEYLANSSGFAKSFSIKSNLINKTIVNIGGRPFLSRASNGKRC